jgi:molybdenum cofactor cytidylyltransferase/nicotine blue oxidoreductase
LTGTAVAVLAAGRGSRLGDDSDTPKPLVEVGGRPLVAWALDAAMNSGLRPTVLVVGYRARAVERVVPQGVTVVRAAGWRHGIARSLRSALLALDGWAQVGAVCIGLADQPCVGPESYRRLAAAHDDGATLAVATYDGVRGNPVLVARTLWPEARRLDGDEGARVLMRTHPVVEVACDGTGRPDDVDTIEDLEAVARVLDHQTERRSERPEEMES